MKPLIVSYADSLGGANKAALRLTLALRASNIKATMQVLRKNTDFPFIDMPSSKIERVSNALKNVIAGKIQNLQQTNNRVLHSGNWFGSCILKNINKSSADLVNLHWCNAETLSIKQIAAINKPLVMTLHDMWAFCGTEHYTEYNHAARFKEGYQKDNRLKDESGLDIDRLIWSRKKKYWSKTFHIVTPSHWLSSCVAESALFKNWPVFTIPNPVSTNLYKPMSKRLCREILQLPLDIPLIGFGAMDTSDYRKGFDLLLESLGNLSDIASLKGIGCVVVGQSKPKQKLKLDMPFYYLGHLYDDYSMMLFYNAIDIMVVPSRQENLPQTATEAQACGTPVAAFDCTGFRSAVEHKKTGYLAKAYDSEDLAVGIKTILEDSDKYQQIQKDARDRAVKLWSQATIGDQYINLYKRVLECGN